MGVVSPLIPGSSTRQSAPGNSLADGRASLQEDIGATVPIISVQRFFDHVFPPLPAAFSLNDTMKHLKNSDRPSYDTIRKGWTVLLNSSAKTENQYYKGLVDISQVVIRAVGRLYHTEAEDRIMDFVNSPNSAPFSDWRDSRHRPDGYFIFRKKRSGEHLWRNMGPTGEYKLWGGERSRLDNTRKALWNMYHSLREDPRRRFAFAFSVEKQNMRFWYANRAEVVVSETFNFMEHPEHLVRFFLVFMYGEPAAMGWDPTMRLITETDPPEYCITVNNAAGDTKSYRTLGLMSSIGAEALRGRGTRVWRAAPCHPKTYEITEAETEVAVKDCWVDQSRDLEGEVIALLDKLATGRITTLTKQLADLQDATPQMKQPLQEKLEAAEHLKASLILPVIHGIVRLPDSAGVSGEKDSTLNRDVALRDGDGKPAPSERIFEEKNAGTEGDASRERLQGQLQGEHRSVWQYLIVRREAVTYESKHHYRIVYPEVCQPLYQIKYLDSIYAHLAELTKALRGLHEAGWVHRDISSGNVLITTRGAVKLSDWEYAKELVNLPSKTHDIRTGTVDFMAVEVSASRYLFMDTADPKTYETQGQVTRIPGRTPPPPRRPAWNYNPLHDVESVYWLTKFFTENHDVVFVSKDDGSELDEDALTALELRQDTDKDARGARLDAQSNQVRKLFHELSERHTELTTPRDSPDEWHIHPTLTDYGVYTDIEAIRVNLVKEYRKVENDFISDPPKPWAIIHNAQLYVQCFGALNMMRLSMQAMPARVRLVPLAVAVQSHDAKKITHAQSAPATTIPRVNVDNPSDAAATGGITERLESLALGPSTTNQLRPASRNELRPGSRTASRAPSRAPSRTASRPPSRAAPGPPSRAASRPASRTGLRSQSRAGRNPSPTPLPNPVPDAHSSLHPASRPASRAAPRPTSRAQTKPSEAGGSSTGATARERALSQPRPPSAGGLNTGKGKGRATTPIPPVPPVPTANARPSRAQATQGAGAATSKPGKPKPGWR